MHIGITGPIYLPSINFKFKGNRTTWPLGMGGVPVNHLINALLELGHKVSVFSSSPEIKVGEFFEWHEENLSVYLGPHRIRPRKVCLDFFFIESNYIKKAILKSNPDFVHAHWQYEWALGALKSGIKTIVTCHDSPINVLRAQTDLYRLYRLFMAFFVIRRAKNLTSVSDYCGDALQKLTSKKINIIPNFEPDFIFSFYKENRVLGKKISITMINNGFTTLKNVSKGILAFEQFHSQNQNSELHLYGDSFGLDQEAYNWCLKTKIRIHNIYFHGSLPFDQLMKELSMSDIFLHTSLEESFGMVLVEAMAMGIPVIAGINSGGPGYILKNGGGLLIDVKSVIDIKKALIKLINPNLYIEVSKVARQVAVKRFGKKNVVNQYLEMYQSLK